LFCVAGFLQIPTPTTKFFAGPELFLCASLGRIGFLAWQLLAGCLLLSPDCRPLFFPDFSFCVVLRIFGPFFLVPFGNHLCFPRGRHLLEVHMGGPPLGPCPAIFFSCAPRPSCFQDSVFLCWPAFLEIVPLRKCTSPFLRF